jgi:hypothetical protein
MSHQNDQLALSAIESATGPSPWYWRTFPLLVGTSGGLLNWQYDASDGKGRAFVALSSSSAPSQYKLILGNHCRPFALESHNLGLWFPEDSSIRLLRFDPELLATIPRPAHFSRLGERYHAATPPLGDFRIPTKLNPGKNEMKYPDWLALVQELVLVGEYEHKQGRCITTVFVLSGINASIDIYPQEWTSGHEGWEWVTRVTRHPSTGLLLGDGVRMRPFELAADNCHLGRYLAPGDAALLP